MKVICSCYGRQMEFDSVEDAKGFFAEGMDHCDPQSSEWHRYACIYLQLCNGCTVCTDE